MNELLAKALERGERGAAEGRAIVEEDARRSIVEADGSFKVYFIRESGMNAIKIGITGDLRKRVAMMRSNTPHDIEVLASIDADDRLEDYLKRRFVLNSIRGEWFYPTAELLECIAIYKALAHESRPYTEEQIAQLVKKLVPL